MAKIVVTGGSGFCGRPIVVELIKRGHDVTVFDTVNKVEDFEDVEFVYGSVVNKTEMDYAFRDAQSVYHVAGQLGTHELFGMLRKAVNINIQGTVNALEAAVGCGVSNFMYPTKPYAWINPYTVTKQCGEEFVKMFGHVYGVNVSVLRWLNVYGPGQKMTPVRKAVPLMCVQALENYPVEVYGSGDAVVDLVYTEDMARLTVEFTEWDKKGDLTKRDLGCTVRMTVNELAQAIISEANSSSIIKHIPMRLGEDSDDPKEQLTSFNVWEFFSRQGVMTPFEEGLRKTLDYYHSIGGSHRRQVLEFYKCQPS